MSEATARGPYRKGLERRRAILEATLTAYATSGPSGPTLKAIAREVGLSETAVLHYFSGRDELFAAVIEARDEAAAATTGTDESLSRYAEVITRNTETPGLVRLFLEVATAAASPDHPGHDYFRARYRRYVEVLAAAVAGHRPDTDPDHAAWTARMLLAAADGLQLQWLHDPTIDMAADLARLLARALDAPSP